MAQLRWGAEVPNDVESARGRLIEAAETCFKRFGVMKTTVEDVARIAQVSRATVYRYFDGRDELILAVLLREADRFLERLGRHLDALTDLPDAIVEGVVYTIRAIRSDENLALLFAPEVAGITSSVAGASKALFEITGQFLRPYLEAAQAAGSLEHHVDIDDAAEWTLRAILSLVMVDGPRHRSEDELRAFLHAFLVPGITGAGGGRPGPARATARRRAPARSRRPT